MPAFIGAIAGGGIDLIGQWAADQAQRRAYNTQRQGTLAGAKAARGVLDQARSRDALGFALQQAQMKVANKRALQGFAGGRRALDVGANQARLGIQDRGRQAFADVEQSAVSSGLIGTTIGQQRLMGAQNQTSRELANIDQQLAQSMASLGLQEAETAAQGEMGLAQLLGQQRMSEQERMQALFALEQVSHPAKAKKPKFWEF